MKPRARCLFASFLAFAMTQASHGADATWTGTTDGDWAKTANWGGVASVPGTGDTATFNSAGNGNTTITTATNLILNKIVFDTASAAAYTLSFTGRDIAWNDGGGVTVTNTVTTNQNIGGTIYNRVTPGQSASFINQGAGQLTLGIMYPASSGSGNAQYIFKPSSSSGGIVLNFMNDRVALTRTASFLLDDAGKVTFQANGSFAGIDSEGNSVTLHQGTLSISNVANSGTNSMLGKSGRIQFGESGQSRTATLDFTGASGSTDRSFYIIDNNTAVFKVSGGASTNLAITSAITQSGSASGGGNLTKDGVGILTLSAANTYTGDTKINNGKISLGNALALQYSAYDTTGSTGAIGLDVTGFTTPTLGGLKGSVDLATAITGYGSVTSLTLNPQSGKSATYSGIISDGDGSISLIKSGAGTQVLSGNNSFTGNVTVDAGTLRLTHNNALGTGTKTLFSQGQSRIVELSGGITLGSNITLTMSSNSGDGLGLSSIDGNNTIQGKINYSFGLGSLNISSSAGSTLTIDGNVELITSSRGLIFGGASTNANTVNGDIGQNSGSNVLSVTKQGAGKWIFNGTNTYTGSTTVSQGTLVIGSGGSIANSSTIHVASGATLDVSAVSSFTVGSAQTLSGSGTISGATSITGTHNPGNSPGIQTFGSDLSYTGGASVVNWELGLNTATQGDPTAVFDQIVVGGNLDFTNLTTLNLLFEGGSVLWADSFWDSDQSWTLYDVAGTTTNFGNLQLTTIDWLDSGSNLFDTARPDASFSLSLSGNDVLLNYTAVPEPRAALLGGIGMLLLLRRRRQ